jgi:Concanavalin A-like lectin/glucanases superfamily
MSVGANFVLYGDPPALTRAEIPVGEHTVIETIVIPRYANENKPPAGELKGFNLVGTKLMAHSDLRGSIIETEKFVEFARPGTVHIKRELKASWELTSSLTADAHGANTLTTSASPPTLSGGWANFLRASSQYLSIASNASVQANVNKSFCIMCVVKPASVNNNMVILGKDSDTDREFTLDWAAGTGQLRFYMFDPSGNAAMIQTSAAFPFTVGQEYRIVAWRDIGWGTLNLEINGVLFSVASVMAMTAKAANFRIGARQHSFAGGEPFDGAIKHVRILHRSPTVYERARFAASTAPYTEFGRISRAKFYKNFAYVGTVVAGSTDTVINTTFSEYVATNELLGNLLTFNANTTTAGLRGITRTVISNTESSITVAALPAIPVAGDGYLVDDPKYGAVLAPVVRDMTIVGDIDSYNVSWQDSPGKGDLLDGINAFASGAIFSNLTFSNIPGTCLFIGKGAAPHGGVFSEYNSEGNHIERVQINGAFRGVQIYDYDTKVNTEFILENIRDWGIQTVSTSAQIAGAIHAYGCGVGALFGLHSSEQATIQQLPTYAKELQTESCKLGFWNRQNGSRVDSLIFFSCFETAGAWLEAQAIIALLQGVANVAGKPGIIVDVLATDSQIGGGRLETYAGCTGLILRTDRFTCDLSTYGPGQSLLVDQPIEDCVIKLRNTQSSIAIGQLEEGNELDIKSRLGAVATITEVGDLNDVRYKTNGGSITIANIAGYGNEIRLKGKAGAANQLKITAISGSNNDIWIWTDNIANVSLPGALGSNRVYRNGVLL